MNESVSEMFSLNDSRDEDWVNLRGWRRANFPGVHRVHVGSIEYHYIRSTKEQFWCSADGFDEDSKEYYLQYWMAMERSGSPSKPRIRRKPHDKTIPILSHEGKILPDARIRLSQLVKGCGSRSKKLGVTFDLTLDWIYEKILAHDARCAVSGIRMEYRTGADLRVWPFTPSLDRVGLRLGYVKPNVRIVCYAVNIGRNDFGDDVYLDVCRAVAEFNRKD
jgi:hypothetical protein